VSLVFSYNSAPLKAQGLVCIKASAAQVHFLPKGADESGPAPASFASRLTPTIDSNIREMTRILPISIANPYINIRR
jgi:hypothetical protein